MFSVMLAAKTTGKGVNFPVFASPKLDGVRAVVRNGVVMSRSMKRIPNKFVQDLFGRPEYEGFDGELIVGSPKGKDVFRRTTSGVMTHEGHPDVVFYVFDDASNGNGFFERFAGIADRLLEMVTTSVVRLEHQMVYTEEELMALEENYLEDGFEGLMVRKMHGPYKQGRSTEREGFLMKLKRFEDSEAVVQKVYQLIRQEESRYNDGEASGLCGSLEVRDLTTGAVFNIGSGYTAEERLEIFKDKEGMPGKIVKYRFFPTGSKDRPRFPIFLGFRSPIDMEV